MELLQEVINELRFGLSDREPVAQPVRVRVDNNGPRRIR